MLLRVGVWFGLVGKVWLVRLLWFGMILQDIVLHTLAVGVFYGTCGAFAMVRQRFDMASVWYGMARA